MVFQRSCNIQSMLLSILKGNVRALHQEDAIIDSKEDTKDYFYLRANSTVNPIEPMNSP